MLLSVDMSTNFKIEWQSGRKCICVVADIIHAANISYMLSASNCLRSISSISILVDF